MITKKILIDDFKEIGLEKGNLIMLHSSLKNIGRVEGGADTVIDAILEVLGKSGTLVVPTYTFSYARREGTEAYNKKTTPPSLAGAISDTLWRRAEAKRSDNPTYSFGAIGRLADTIVKNHPLNIPLGIGSPLFKLANSGGKVLLIGVGQDRNSVIHVAESISGATYRSIPFKEKWGKFAKRINESGKEEIVLQSEFPGCSYNFGIVEDILKSSGIIKYGKVGNADTQSMIAKDVIGQIVELLKKQPGFLLCDREECECCSNRKIFLRSI